MSDSYAATEAALAAAGAQPGDAVHVFGFSQGAMIGAHLALEGPYDTQTLVSLGSPVDADVGPGTLSVSVRHSDDPVVALAGGGHGEPVGASGSFIVERVADPDVALDDTRLPAHRLTVYAETAALVDASADPRVDGLRGVFDELAQAESVEVTEYAATRGAG
jgi:pimeloyl-ACP methyl ester carboxylesterase